VDIRKSWVGGPTDREVGGVSGSDYVVTGEYQVSWTIGSKVIQAKLLDMPKSCFAGILGLHVLFSMGVDIRLVRRCLIFPDGEEVPMYGLTQYNAAQVEGVISSLTRRAGRYNLHDGRLTEPELETNVCVARDTTIIQAGPWTCRARWSAYLRKGEHRRISWRLPLPA
jgi:hypothetical protein